MKKGKGAFYAFGIAAAIRAFAFCMGFADASENVVASADVIKTYSTKTNISQQGENGFYYAWGKPEKYVLMTYGAVSGGGYGWRGIEPYSTISGSGLHPGNYYGVLVVWVAPESGTVRLTGAMEKGTSNGDGVNLGVYHQNYGGKLDVLFEKFVDNGGALKYSLEQSVEVSRGDSFLFYCDSGNGKDNPSDSTGCPFTIVYTQSSGDSVKNEDLSEYLNVKTAGEVAGFQHIEQDFQAEVLDGTLTEKITYERGGCSSSVSALTLAPFAAVPLMLIRRKKK